MANFKGFAPFFQPSRFFFVLVLLLSHASRGGEGKLIHWEDSREGRPWVDRGENSTRDIRFLLAYLAMAPTGKRLLERAKKKALRLGQSLDHLIREGERSLTDITLVRRFHPEDWKRFDHRVKFKIHIDRRLTMLEAALDLAHELSHFIERETFNPYSSTFSAPQFMAHTIEGKGGEVQAYIAECRVLDELGVGSGKMPGTKCHKIRLKDGRYSPSRAAKLFYRVGRSYGKVKAALGFLGAAEESIQLISPRHPVFISSAHETPYPLAALNEYVSIVEKACRNDRRRMANIERGRGKDSTQAFLRFRRDYRARCSRPALFQIRDILAGRVVKRGALVYTPSE